MTPKEKAEELYNKFNPHVLEKDFFGNNVEHNKTKQCALIACDEIIETEILIDEDVYVETPSYLQYWKEVKQEIEKL